MHTELNFRLGRHARERQVRQPTQTRSFQTCTLNATIGVSASSKQQNSVRRSRLGSKVMTCDP